jgi:integrase
MKMKMPKYTQAFVDRHGTARFYFRKAGNKQVPLPGPPWSPQFMAAYEAALEYQGPRIDIGASRTKPGTINALVVSYFNSLAFQALAPETRRTRRNILERFRAEHGDKRSALLKREHVNVMFANKATTRFAARNWLKTVRALMQFAVAESLLTADPTAGIKNLSGKTDGFRTWNEDDIAAFEARHPIGTRERLALALLLNTAQRRGDVVRMGRQHVRKTPDGPLIDVKQQKTGTKVAIPIHPDLQTVLDATPSDHLTFLTTAFGKPFAAAGFTNWFRAACNAAGLPRGTSAHGLRKAAARRLAEAGCSANVIASITGHKSLNEVERYTIAANQERMARMGVETLIAETKERTGSVKPVRRFDRKTK